jgi:hypothetical protein
LTLLFSFPVFGSWNFLIRHPQALDTNESLLTANPNLLSHTLLWSIFFSTIYFIGSTLSKYLYPGWYSSLTTRKKSEVPSYSLALAHHLIVVPLSIYFIYLDYSLPSTSEVPFDYFQTYSPLLSYSFGYFVADTLLYTIPEALSGHYAYFIHHLFAVGLLFSVAQASGPCVRALPHFLLMELSSIFFSAAWLLRQIGYRGTVIVTIFEQLFVAFYFILRILHLPLLLFALTDHVHTLGLFRYCLVGVMILQVYWFYQIIQTLRVRDMGGGKGKAKGEVKEGKGKEVKSEVKNNQNKAKEQ